ncbi:MAG: Type 1 glutamine amidotransferase-like domain-containing protein, partial [Waterburya sp.]
MPEESPLRQIVAMGGGGWGMEPDNPLLDLYIYNLSKKEKPRICFIPTASGDS